METKEIIKPKGRNANIEILRIISVCMVLLLHTLLKSGALDYLSGIHYYVYWGLEAASYAAVNLFVLISGYFMVCSPFKAKNVFKVAVGGVWIYSVVFSLVELLVSGGPLTLSGLVYMLFPVFTKRFWFVNVYVAMYILSPFINKMIRSLSKKQFSALVVTLMVLFSAIPTVQPIRWSLDSNGDMGLAWFITLYCVAAWLRLYYQPTQRPLKYILVYLTSVLLLLGSKKVLLLLGFGDYSGKLYAYSSVVVLVGAVALFLAFLNAKPITGKTARVINTVARYSFSVYIIHFAMWNVLFTDILHVDRYVGNVATGIPAVLLAVVIVYAFCTAVDIVKVACFKKIGEHICGTMIVQRWHTLLEKWENIVNG